MIKFKYALAFLLLGYNFLLAQKSFVWYDGNEAVSYNIAGRTAPVVKIALDMFTEDMKLVTGKPSINTSSKKAKIKILQLDSLSSNSEILSQLGTLQIPWKEIASKKDAFYLAVIKKGTDRKIYIIGNNGRGTAYGILELSRIAGVSPWVWWGDVTPFKREQLTIPADFSTLQSPSVEYRGIFLNDEDWSLQPWSWKHFEPSNIPGRIGAKTYKEIFKLLLRLRANTIWPGMHGITTPFYFVPGAKEVADSCGIVIGTSHCEPMMRNNVGEWNESVQGAYNYKTNRAKVQEYWAERLKEVHKYQNIYTLGMRGIHDGAMEGAKTIEEQTKLLQEVIDDQRKMLVKYVNKNVEKIPQQFVPYKEVLSIMDKGLKIPDDVTFIWCDDNYGYLTRLSDSDQQKRSGGAGVYYHLQYWGRPHDYMWLSSIQPGLIYNEMKKAYDSNARKIWIVNVHDMKTAAYDMELFLDLAWNIDVVKPSTINRHIQNWLCREFGNEAGEMLLPAVLEYYRLVAIRKPEFMGWSQVELDKNRFARGRSPVIDTEFSLIEFGGELDRYLEDFENVKKIVLEAEKIIHPNRIDAFFSHVKYPVMAAAAMSTKMLEAQRARTIASGNYDNARWTREPDLMKACTKSMNAYFEIRRLTDYWNNEMADGKWKYSMCFYPRDLYVFFPPTIPIGPTENEISQYAHFENQKSIPYHKAVKNAIARNACDYTRVSKGVYFIQTLGHSMKALVLPKNTTVTYEFECEWAGEAILRTAVIPTHPNEKNSDLRFSVSINGSEPKVHSIKEGYRTESWKQNVLRAQAIRTTTYNIVKGKQTLTITALDEHVIIDQWMLDFQSDRKFYVFPVKPSY